MAVVPSEWLELFRSKRRLDREKGYIRLEALLEKGPLDEAERVRLEAIFAERVSSLTATWEEKHGGIWAATLLTASGSDSFCERLENEIPLLLENEESRIRLAAGELLGRLCARCGPGVYERLDPVLVAGIEGNLERDMTAVAMDPALVEKLGRTSVNVDDRPLSPSAAQVFHDTAGWKSLESYMLAQEQAVVGCGASFEPFITTELLEMVSSTLPHTNRFVREMSFKVLAAIVKCPNVSRATVDAHWRTLATSIATGLADNWSQVRMAASIAAREFLYTIEPKEDRELYWPILLPAMCLNRYYVAEGVRLYSQETWRNVTEGKGVSLVEKHIVGVVEFYISQSQAANHAVREAACTCIAELGKKVSREVFRPFIKRLIEVLLECFRDDSWPVRDAACLACGNFVACAPEECHPYLDDLLPLFFGNLGDSIPSVRQGGAAALGCVTRAYVAEVEEKVFSVIDERLPLAATQTDTEEKHPDIDPSPATYGVVRRIQVVGDAAHTDQQMYSCGSLAPKMRRGGCMDDSFHKAAQPWEKSHGCVYLIGELTKQPVFHDRLAGYLPILAEAARHKHYSQHLLYLETVVKYIPTIARNLGKKLFKAHLELLLDPLFYALVCDSSQTRQAAADCIATLNTLLGRMIMRGRIEQHNPRYLQLYDHIR